MSGKVHPKVWTGHIKQAIVSSPHQSTVICLSKNLFYPLTGFQRCPKGSYTPSSTSKNSGFKAQLFTNLMQKKSKINADNADR